MRKVPKLRFKEFSEEWEEKRLGEIIEQLIAGVSVNSNEQTQVNSNTKAILKTSCIYDGKFIENEAKEILLEEINKVKLFAQKGQILISRMNTPQLVGALAYIEKDFYNRYLPDRIWQTKFKNEEYDGKFLSYLLNTPKYNFKIRELATGTSNSMKNISKENFLNLSIFIPLDIEQEKIANFLSNIDKKISLTEEKLELFREYKKGVMQKIFSQELRFKDSDGNDYPEWKEKRLGEILTSKSSAISQNTLENNEGIYSVYGAIGKIKNINFYENENEYIGIVKDGAGVGRTFLCEKKSSVLGTLNYLELKTKSIYLKFAYYILKQIDFSKYIVGSSIPHIYFKDYKNEKIQLPILEEQQKIADFLSSIDSKIESIEKEFEGLKEFKKGLLQQMFV